MVHGGRRAWLLWYVQASLFSVIHNCLCPCYVMFE
jgi:hypothetical protein